MRYKIEITTYKNIYQALIYYKGEKQTTKQNNKDGLPQNLIRVIKKKKKINDIISNKPELLMYLTKILDVIYVPLLQFYYFYYSFKPVIMIVKH